VAWKYHYLGYAHYSDILDMHLWQNWMPAIHHFISFSEFRLDWLSKNSKYLFYQIPISKTQINKFKHSSVKPITIQRYSVLGWTLMFNWFHVKTLFRSRYSTQVHCTYLLRLDAIGWSLWTRNFSVPRYLLYHHPSALKQNSLSLSSRFSIPCSFAYVAPISDWIRWIYHFTFPCC
jgi:hypothetical protein